MTLEHGFGPHLTDLHQSRPSIRDAGKRCLPSSMEPHLMQARGVVVGVRVCARTDGACASFPNSTSIMRRVGAVEEEADGSLLPPLLQRRSLHRARP